MTEIDYCEHHCDGLTQAQVILLTFNIKNGRFLGVAPALGRSALMPMVQMGKRPPSVIDKTGHYQTSSLHRRTAFPYVPKPVF